MATRKPAPPLPPAKLAVPRAKALEEVKSQIEEAAEVEKAIQASGPFGTTEEAVGLAESRVRTWTEISSQVLKAVFTTPEKALEFERAGISFVIGARMTPHEELQALREKLGERTRKLESFAQQIERGLFEAPASTGGAPSRPAPGGAGVFIVHGHDTGLRESTARLLKDLGIGAVILAEKPNKGRSIIEKLEEEGSQADYAVILLTGDDEGRKRQVDPKNALPLQPRARQNVVLELGWFFARLTRKRVAILHEEGAELPSDTHGITYLPVNAAWPWKLASELKAAGFDIDMNKVTL